MKKTILTGVLCALASGATAADGFTIRGEIPGLKPGMTVSLENRDGSSYSTIATAGAVDGIFILTGSVPRPATGRIIIESAGDDRMESAIPLMIENATYTVRAEHVDSLPPSFYFGSHGLELEHRISVEGGEYQRQFAEYRNALYDANRKAADAHYAAYIDPGRTKDEASDKARARALADAQKEVERITDEFIAAHPGYSISGRIYTQKLGTPFSFTAEELDAIGNAVAGMSDTARLADVNRAVAAARNTVRGCDYFDFEATDAEGNVRRLADVRGPGYTLVDFWASWCGPCRAAIPHVKELAGKYDGKLTVISCSLDSDEAAWRAAMADEDMPWAQLWGDKDHVKGITDPYRIHGIPFLVVISPEGKIAHAGHDPNTLSGFLEKNIR